MPIPTLASFVANSPLKFGVGWKLESYGFSVDTATTLAEARSALTRFIPDVVLVDLNLPDGSGQEIIELIAAKSYSQSRATRAS